MNKASLLVRIDHPSESDILSLATRGEALVVPLSSVAAGLGFRAHQTSIAQLALIARAAASLAAKSGVSLPVLFTVLHDDVADDAWADAFLHAAGYFVRGIAIDALLTYLLPGHPIAAAIMSALSDEL